MKQPQSSQPRRTPLLIAGALLLFVVAAGVGILASREPAAPKPQAGGIAQLPAITVYKPPT